MARCTAAFFLLAAKLAGQLGGMAGWMPARLHFAKLARQLGWITGWMHGISQALACQLRTRPVLVAARPPRAAATPPNGGMLEGPSAEPPHDDGRRGANVAGAFAAEIAADSAATVKPLPAAWEKWSRNSIKRALARVRQAQRQEFGLAPCRCAQGCVCNAAVAEAADSSCKKEVAGPAAPSCPGHTPQVAAAAATASGEAPPPQPRPLPRLVPRFKAPPLKRPSTEAGRS